MAKRFNSWPVRGGVNGPSTGTVKMREPNEAQFINPPVWAVPTGAVNVVARPPKATHVPRRVTVAVSPMVGERIGKRSRIKAVR
jgi:hypothetical protein